MKRMPFDKYESYPQVSLKERQWPQRRITKAPIWCSVDLRDGNQALSVPMDVEQKLRFFHKLVEIGFKEIEVGFPSALETEYQFVRKLIDENHIPNDVTIQVLTQAREHLIQRTMEAIKGAERVIVHVYNSTSRVQREVVFKKTKAGIKEIAVEGVRLIKEFKNKIGMPDIILEYSPESFTGTELDYALEVCEAVIDVWQPTPNGRMIINLPAAVEMSMPNIYADRIEGFSRSVKKRDSVIISVHTHNDRGCAVAAAELAIMGGAERIEGALFGNGERSGNMDIVIMALNLFSQRIDPELDFSQMNEIIKVYQECTGMDIHPRHPYAGDLVYTAFSGSHQDAINKGMKARKETGKRKWDVPYIPIDPQDIGRNYEAIVRINSQSGKGGVCFVLEHDYGLKIPKWMQTDVGRVIKEATDDKGAELSSRELYHIFFSHYEDPKLAKLSVQECYIDTHEKDTGQTQDPQTKLNAVININGEVTKIQGYGNGPIDAFVNALRQKGGIIPMSVSLTKYAEHALGQGSDATAITYVALENGKGDQAYGVGRDPNISMAFIKAIVHALNRIL